jgi:hypothetical protein
MTSPLRPRITLGAAPIIMTFTVAATKTATLGFPIIASSADGEVLDSTTQSDLTLGVALETAAAGARVQVLMYAPVAKVKVGTGGATYGKKAYFPAGADGYADAPAHDSSGAVDGSTLGVFVESGVAGDYVGMMMVLGNRGSA